MKSSVMGRIVWKEVRHLIAFFFATLVLAGIFQTITGLTLDMLDSRFGKVGEYRWAIIGCFAALFAAACGGTLFATEKEEGTIQNLQLLPISSQQLMSGKLVAALALCGAWMALAAIICFPLAGATRDAMSGSTGWLAIFMGTFGLAVIEFFAWSLLFSICISRPLIAALLGIFFASAGIQVSVLLTHEAAVDHSTVFPYLAAWKTRAAIAGTVLIAGVWLASDWLHSRPKTHHDSTRRLSKMAGWISRPFRLVGGWFAKQTRPVSRMLWQTARESSVGGMIAYAVTVAFGIMLTVLNPNFYLWTFLATACAGGFVGLTAFSADQKGNAWRFPGARGVSPLQLWFARVSPWMIAICSVHVLYFVTLAIGGSFLAGPLYDSLAIPGLDTSLNPGYGLPLAGSMYEFVIGHGMVARLGLFCGYLSLANLLCFSAGQLVSLLIRSRLLAMVATAIVCVPLVFWLALMMAGGVPIWWSVMPIAVAMLGGGWLAIRSLLFERSLANRIVGPILLVSLVASLIIFSVCRYRINEIPIASVEFDRRDTPDPGVLSEIKTRFIKVKHLIGQANWLTEQISDFYPVIRKSSKEPADVDAILLKRLTQHEQEFWKLGKQVVKPEEMNEFRAWTEQFLENNRQLLAEIGSATDFAFGHTDQILRLPPLNYFGNLDASPLPHTQAVWRLLENDFRLHISSGDASAAWQRLQTMSRFGYLAALLQPDERFWYEGVMDHLATWALCENQTPDLLDKGFHLIKEELIPVSEKRMLEFERRKLLTEIEYGGFERPENASPSDNFAASVLAMLQRLPSEKERARRLVDTWVSAASFQIWKSQNPGKAEVTSYDIRRKEPEWMKVPSHDYQSAAWARTTLTPSPTWNGYIRQVTTPEHLIVSNPADLNERYREQKEMLLLQNRLLKYKLEHEQFPEDLDDLDEPPSVNFKRPVQLEDFDIQANRYYYYPHGLPHVTTISRKESSYCNRMIPADTPFITNRQPIYCQGEVDYLENSPTTFKRLERKYVLPWRSGLSAENAYEPEPMLLPLESR